MWTRFRGDPQDVTTSQALLGFASDGFLIGTAMRPHPGAGQRLAHVSISTSVIAHALSFHEQFDVAVDADAAREPLRRSGTEPRTRWCTPKTGDSSLRSRRRT